MPGAALIPKVSMMSYSSAGIQSEAFNERESNSQIFSECQIHIQFQNLNLTQTKKQKKTHPSKLWLLRLETKSKPH